MKKEISQAFKQLEKYGFIVRNLQFYKAYGKGAIDLPDIVIIGKRCKGDIHFVEIKIGKDKLSRGQRIMKEYLEKTSNYYIANESNYNDIIEQIFGFSGS